MAARQSEKIKLWGIVQGVGFRPYVAKTAEALGIKGQVLNIGGLVEITVTDTPSRISSFIEHIIADKPAPAEMKRPCSPLIWRSAPTASTSFTLKATRGISILS